MFFIEAKRHCLRARATRESVGESECAKASVASAVRAFPRATRGSVRISERSDTIAPHMIYLKSNIGDPYKINFKIKIS